MYLHLLCCCSFKMLTDSTTQKKTIDDEREDNFTKLLRTVQPQRSYAEF